MPLLDIDPLTGAVETMQYDHTTKSLQITRTENVDAILAANAASFNDGGEAWRGEGNDFWRVASIPLTTLFAWLQEFNKCRSADAMLQSPFENNDEWDRFIYGRLNSTDYRKLKTADVRI